MSPTKCQPKFWDHGKVQTAARDTKLLIVIMNGEDPRKKDRKNE